MSSSENARRDENRRLALDAGGRKFIVSAMKLPKWFFASIHIGRCAWVGIAFVLEANQARAIPETTAEGAAGPDG